VFGGVCFSTGSGDDLNGVFEDPTSLNSSRIMKLQVLHERRNVLKGINDYYLESSNNTYKIEGLFNPKDVIMPTNHTEQQ
jgi:hypothetical protein